jgi:hypothetical protein
VRAICCKSHMRFGVCTKSQMRFSVSESLPIFFFAPNRRCDFVYAPNCRCNLVYLRFGLQFRVRVCLSQLEIAHQIAQQIATPYCMLRVNGGQKVLSRPSADSFTVGRRQKNPVQLGIMKFCRVSVTYISHQFCKVCLKLSALRT